MPLYFDEPQWVSTQYGGGELRCRVRIQNFDLFLERNKGISFIVYRKCAASQQDPNTLPEWTVKESIQPIHKDLIEAIHKVLESKEEYTKIKQVFGKTCQLHSPYLFVFHQQDEWESIRNSLPEPFRQHMVTLWDYIIKNYGHEYATASRCMSDGMITPGYMNYLFKPGETIVQRRGDQYIGWVARSWARVVKPPEKEQRNADRESQEESDDFSYNPINFQGGTYPRMEVLREAVIPINNPENTLKTISSREVIKQEWNIDAWNWVFDGKFQRREGILTFYIQASAEAVGIKSTQSQATEPASKNDSSEYFTPITELEVFPISHAPDELTQKLRKRGKTFWRCRNRRFVSYQNDINDNSVSERYMIDVKTYRTLHSHSNFEVLGSRERTTDQLGEEAMLKDEPPKKNFELLLPPTTKGFNLRTKKWYDLNVDQVNEVTWNKDVFNKVELEPDSKDLIKALVSNTIATERNTDLIQGKGNGLILLLHGSPGTGKTLTAESVAEMTGKPLYRVTCGDIGTKAEEVEKYLESVFYLGRLWDCVVLLDEADIFLEKRSIEDLDRNALVSVFLRVLEYYEGILILTSNRVEIFDEAFKSRIQLALYYPELGPSQRRRIWRNFLDRLSEVDGEAIDLDDLHDNLDDLKDVKMNGREIRNAITTARQLAQFRNERLNYWNLKTSITVSRRFDKFVKNEDESVEDGRATNDWMR
ncbi:hypothetical protein F5B19DRAFT_33422 [Rostrohypoxylon terebratum]|nr:hypothetical protein F5B19DRAFT_33422 [Rostrohypoxylon terebratum]